MTAWAYNSGEPDHRLQDHLDQMLEGGISGWAGKQRDNGPILIALATLFLGLSTIVVSLRLYTRRCILNSVGVDDYCTLAGLVFAVGHTICIVLSVSLADLGKHIWMVPLSEMATKAPLNLKLGFAGTIFSYACTAFLRASIIFFLLRLKPISRHLRLALRVLLSMVIIMAVVAILTVILRCVPIEDQWSLEPGKVKKCMSMSVHTYIIPSCFVALSTVIYIVPLPLLLKLEFPTRQKVALLAAYHMGFLGVVGCILQLVYSRVMIYTQDPLWDASFSVIWLLIEIHTMIIGCSFPILKALYTHLGSNKVTAKGEVVELDRVHERMEIRKSQFRRPSVSTSKFPGPLAFLQCAPKATTSTDAEVGKVPDLKIHTFDPDFYADTPPSTAGPDSERDDKLDGPEGEQGPVFSFGATAPLPYAYGSTEDILGTGRPSSPVSPKKEGKGSSLVFGRFHRKRTE